MEFANVLHAAAVATIWLQPLSTYHQVQWVGHALRVEGKADAVHVARGWCHRSNNTGRNGDVLLCPRQQAFKPWDVPT